MLILNGIVSGNGHSRFMRHQFAEGVFDAAPHYVHVSGSAMGFSRADERRPHKAHQWHWSDTMQDGWFQEWAAERDGDNFFGRSTDLDIEPGSPLIVFWDSEPLWHDAVQVAHPSFASESGGLSAIGKAYNEIVPEALVRIGGYIIDRARSRWPNARVYVGFSNLVRQPGYRALAANQPTAGALRVANGLAPHGFALTLNLRLSRSDSIQTVEQAEAYATMAISSRAAFANPFSYAQSWWEGEPGKLPLPAQIAGIGRACAKAGLPLVITGDNADIDRKVGLDRFEANIIEARRLGGQTPSIQTADLEDDVD